jgi:predicted secreted protein
MAESQGIIGHGTVLAGSTFGTVAQVVSISPGGREADAIELSNMDSPEKWREFIAGMKNPGELGCTVVYKTGGVLWAALNGAIGSANETWTITFTDGSTLACKGFIQSVGDEVPFDNRFETSVTIKLSGLPTFTAGTT